MNKTNHDAHTPTRPAHRSNPQHPRLHPLHPLPHLLPLLRPPPSPSSPIPPISALLWQIYGSLILALTIPILLCIPSSSSSSCVAAQRRIVYQTLLAGEALLVPLLLRHAVQRPEPGAPTRVSLALATASLLPFLAWHGFVLYVRPDLMQGRAAGPSGSAKKKKKTL